MELADAPVHGLRVGGALHVGEPDELHEQHRSHQARSQGFYSWTPLTYLLDAKKVSWRYYLAQGTTPDCDNDEAECPPQTQLANVPSIWNPLPLFDTVKTANEETTNVVTIDHFYTDVKAGTLPACRGSPPRAR